MQLQRVTNYLTRGQHWLVFFLLGIFLMLTIQPVLSQITIPNKLGEPRQLVEQSQKFYQQGNYAAAIELLQQAISIFQAEGKPPELAIAFTNLGRLHLALGQAEIALSNWQQATQIYRQLNDSVGISNSQILQAQAWQKLGLYPRACETLTQALKLDSKLCQEQNLTPEIITTVRTNFGQATDSNYINGLRHLGDVWRVIGKLESSRLVLETIADYPSAPESQAAVKLSLGNTWRSLGNLESDRQAAPKFNYSPWRCEPKIIPQMAQRFYELADKQYQQAVELSSSTNKTKTQLNRLNLLLEMDRTPLADSLVSQINISNLPLNQFRVYAQINYAKSLSCRQQKTSQSVSIKQPIINQVKAAIQDAKELKDRHTESYALGNLAGLYEYLGQREEALKLTQEALYLAQPNEAPQIAYQWQWQRGRLLEAEGEGKKEEAIAAYEEAVKTLESVRSDLLTINSDVQFSFRDNIEPLYRGLVNLLLSSQKNELEADRVQKSLYYVESLQLAELQNFLQCNPANFRALQINSGIAQDEPTQALIQRLQQVHQNDPTAALIYPIVLPNRLEVIVSLSGKPLRREAIALSEDQFEETVKRLRQALNSPDRSKDVKVLSQQIYSWLIQPFTADLTPENQVKTLVFVLDSFFQNIPMAALYDGKQYLVQKYGIALVPSLQLLDVKPVPRRQISALIAGATNAPSFQQQGLGSLPNIEREVAGISQEVKGGKTLLEQEFTQNNVQKQIDATSFEIVHLATHGNFSSNPEQTYLLDWNRRIAVKDLDNLLRFSQQQESQSIELLVLSACQTATGDRRAALGLAGVSIRAGARSTLATLWQVNDASTAELMIQFYRQLKDPQITKAEALRRAQLALLENYPDTDYNRSYYWAPFAIVGNWL